MGNNQTKNMPDKRKSISISFDPSLLDAIDHIARQQRIKTGENVTRSGVVRAIVNRALRTDAVPNSPLSPASRPTPEGGRPGERSDAGAGGVTEHGED